MNASGAMLFSAYRTLATQTEVTRWFASELRRSGWTAVPNPVRTTSTDVVATVEWRRDGRSLTLELLAPAYAGRLGATQVQPCSSGYRTVVQ